MRHGDIRSKPSHDLNRVLHLFHLSHSGRKSLGIDNSGIGRFLRVVITDFFGLAGKFPLGRLKSVFDEKFFAHHILLLLVGLLGDIFVQYSVLTSGIDHHGHPSG